MCHSSCTLPCQTCLLHPRWCATQELGLDAVAAEMAAETARPAKIMRKKREKVPEEQLERRVSFRERKPINYCEMMERAAREAREPVDHSARIAVSAL